MATLFGRSGRVEKIPTQDPRQQQFSQQALAQAQQMLPNLSQTTTTPAEAALRRHTLQTKTVPSIAERFTAMGGSGQRSSGFEGALGSAGSELELNLAAMDERNRQSDLNRQMQLFGGLSNLGMQPSFQREYVQGDPGLVSQIGTPLLSGLGAGAGAYMASGGNPLAALMSGLGGILGGRKEGESQIRTPVQPTQEQVQAQFPNTAAFGSGVGAVANKDTFMEQLRNILMRLGF